MAIAQRCAGLSGADISVLVRDALMQPIRELQHAALCKGIGRKLGAMRSTGRGAKR